MQTETLSLRFITVAIALAGTLWIAANGGIFMALYGDTLIPLTIPYVETFTDQQRVDYRRVFGLWRIQDQTLVQSDTNLADVFAVIPIELTDYPTYLFGAHMQVQEGPNGAGLLFNMQRSDLVDKSQIVRFGVTDGRPYLAFGYFDEKGQFFEQGNIEPPDTSQGVELAVAVYPDHYDILVNGQPQQREIPLQYHGGKVALTTWFSKVAFDDVTISTAMPPVGGAAFVPAAATAPLTATVGTTTNLSASVAQPVDTGAVTTTVTTNATDALTTTAANLFIADFAAGVDQSQWTSFSGDWRFTADALIQQQSDGYDYSISHGGSFSQFTLRVRFQHRSGIAGGGLLFNMPEFANKQQGHMVRYYEGRALVWGYFDAQGNFVGQGDKAVDPPGEQSHTLQVVATSTVYSILLDDTLIAENIPLVSPGGHLGLTASQSVVAFEHIEVSTLPAGNY